MPVREPVPSGRSGIAAVLSLLLTAHAALLLASPRPALAAPWRQPGFAASRSSFNPREIAVDPANVGSLVERWRAPGVGVTGSIVSGGGRVFGSNGGEMIALSIANGAELWRTAAQDEFWFGSPVLTPDGKVTSEELWIGGGGTALFDPASGTYSPGVGGGFHSRRFNHAIHKGIAYALDLSFGSGGPFLVTLGPYDGLVDYSGFPPPPWRGLAVHGDHAFTGVGSTLEAFDLLSCPDPLNFAGMFVYCRPAWTAVLPGGFSTPVAFRGSVAVASDDGTLQVRAAADGALEWSATVAAGVGHAPAVAKRRIFVPTDRGVIVAFDSRGCGSATCEPVERFRTGSPATGQAVVAGKVLYAGTKDGRIVAFRASGCPEAVCDPLLDVDLGGGAIVAGPIVVDGTVIAATADGQLVALGLPQPE